MPQRVRFRVDPLPERQVQSIPKTISNVQPEQLQSALTVEAALH